MMGSGKPRSQAKIPYLILPLLSGAFVERFDLCFMFVFSEAMRHCASNNVFADFARLPYYGMQLTCQLKTDDLCG